VNSVIQIAALALVLATTPAQDPKTTPKPTPTSPKPDAAPKLDAAAGESAAPLARLAPKDAFFLVQAKNLDALRADFEAGAWFGLYQDEEMKGLRGWFEEAWKKQKEAATAGASSSGSSSFDPWEVVRSVHGAAAGFAVLQSGQKEPALGLLVDPGEPRGPFEDFAAKCLEDVRHQPGMIEASEEYAGVELRTFEKKPEEKAEDESAKTGPKHANGKEKEEDAEEDDEAPREKSDKIRHFAYFERGGVAGLVMAPEREQLLEVAHGIIDRSSGKDPSPGVEGSSALGEARASVAKPGRVELFLDLAKVIELMKAESPPKEEDEKIQGKLGVDGLRWVYASADLGKGENVSLDFSVRIPEKGYLREWIGLLGKAPKELAALAPRDSAAVSIGQFDLWGLWQSTWKFAAEVNADATEKVRSQMEAGLAQVGAGDLEKSLLAQIDGRFLSFEVAIPEDEWLKAQAPEGLQSSEGPSAGSTVTGHQGTAMVFGLRDAQAVARFVEQILKGIGAFDAVKTEDFQGNQVFAYSMGAGPSFQWAFLKQGLAFSRSPTAIRAALRMEGAERKDSALEKESFKPLYDAHADAGVLGLATTADSLKSGLAVVQTMREMTRKGGSADDGPLEHLPTTAAIDRHFHGTIATTVSRAGGVLHLQLSCR
jgi:hypothetical protein